MESSIYKSFFFLLFSCWWYRALVERGSRGNANMITREADYAIRVLVALAGRYKRGGEAAPVNRLASELDIPYRFLRKLTKKMVAKRLIASRRGRRGGVVLTRPPSKMTLYHAIAAMAPMSTTLSPCIAEPKFCGRSPFCTVHRELRRIQSDVDRRLKRLTLKRLLT